MLIYLIVKLELEETTLVSSCEQDIRVNATPNNAP